MAARLIDDLDREIGELRVLTAQATAAERRAAEGAVERGYALSLESLGVLLLLLLLQTGDLLLEEGRQLLQLGTEQLATVLQVLREFADQRQVLAKFAETWPPTRPLRLICWMFATPQQSLLHELAALLGYPPYGLLLRLELMVCQWAGVLSLIAYFLQEVKPDFAAIIQFLVSLVFFNIISSFLSALSSQKDVREAGLTKLRAVRDRAATAAEAAAAPPGNGGGVPPQLQQLRAALLAWKDHCTDAVQHAEARLAAMPN